MYPPGVIEWPPLSSVTMTAPGGYFFNCEKKKDSRFKRLEAVQVLLTAAAGVVNPHIEITFQTAKIFGVISNLICTFRLCNGSLIMYQLNCSIFMAS